MKPETPNGTQRSHCSERMLCVTAGLCLLALVSCRKEPSASGSSVTAPPSPPDVSGCTRLEIRFLPSTLEWVFIPRDNLLLFSAEELERIKSFDRSVVQRAELIRKLARAMSHADYVDASGPALGGGGGIRVVCYADHEALTSLTFIGAGFIRVEDAGCFWVPPDSPLRRFYDVFTPELMPFVLREECAFDLVGIYHKIFRKPGADFKLFPPSDQWCEAVLDAFRKGGSQDEKVIHYLQCPSAGEGKSHYAMNPNCRSDSPSDMVLLFEAGPGWNQHGGAGLFSFENHDPRGGNVLLKNGTVKFIRTEEELQQLRWK